MVKLSVALHSAAPRPEGHTDEDELVQATNLWFDAEVEAQDLLDALEDGLQGVSRLFEVLYDEQTTFYRIWDNYGPPEHEPTEEDKDEFTPEDAFYYGEWHAEVDWSNGRYLTLLGAGFDEPLASDDLIAHLKDKATS